jgi:hypothetical protein
MWTRTDILINICLSLALLTGLGGCETTGKQTTGKAQIMSTGVFSEVQGDELPPQGNVDLVIKASIKKHVKGHYLLEPKTIPEGKDGYPFLLNIDGQAIAWKVEGKLEVTPRYNENGRRMPEGGKGNRYVLDKKIRLKPGPHHVLFGLMDEDYYTEFDISLRDGESHVLEFRPIYAKGRKGYKDFYHGIKNYRIFLDGNHIK